MRIDGWKEKTKTEAILVNYLKASISSSTKVIALPYPFCGSGFVL